MEFEYALLTKESDGWLWQVEESEERMGNRLIGILSAKGAKGWEVVSATSDGTDFQTLLLKKPLVS